MHAQHVLNFTGENVQLSGVHGDAIKCAGVIIGFPCVDMHGNCLLSHCRRQVKELSHARVKQKQAALDTLNGSAADDPGIVKLKAYKQELDEFIKMAEETDTQPFEGIKTFQQAHELRADWADATSLAWDGSRYYLMIVEKNQNITLHQLQKTDQQQAR